MTEAAELHVRSTRKVGVEILLQQDRPYCVLRTRPATPQRQDRGRVLEGPYPIKRPLSNSWNTTCMKTDPPRLARVPPVCDRLSPPCIACHGPSSVSSTQTRSHRRLHLCSDRRRGQCGLDFRKSGLRLALGDEVQRITYAYQCSHDLPIRKQQALGLRLTLGCKRTWKMEVSLRRDTLDSVDARLVSLAEGSSTYLGKVSTKVPCLTQVR